MLEKTEDALCARLATQLPCHANHTGGARTPALGPVRISDCGSVPGHAGCFVCKRSLSSSVQRRRHSQIAGNHRPRQNHLNGICQTNAKTQKKNLPPAAGIVPANGMCSAAHGVPLDDGTLGLVVARLGVQCLQRECAVFVGVLRSCRGVRVVSCGLSCVV